MVPELGGNAACIVDKDADLDDAVTCIIFGAFYQSGQSCISVQRILAHQAIYDDLEGTTGGRHRKTGDGDLHDEATFIGPMISVKEAERLQQWVTEAVIAGAKVLCGGNREGAMLEATLLENVPAGCALNQEEAFGRWWRCSAPSRTSTMR